MGYIRWVFWLIVWTFIAAFFHYTLPQRDIVYVTGTEIIRQDFSGMNRIFYAQADSGNTDPVVNRDLRLINTTRSSGGVMVFRNEDTGFGWPPYFKLDSSNLQAEAQGATSTSADPQWYLLKHYGWRNEFLTIYPNAISLTPIAGPEVGKPIPFLNIAILVVFFAVVWAIWVRWRRFRQKRIDPVLEEMGDSIADAGDSLSRTRKRWFGR